MYVIYRHYKIILLFYIYLILYLRTFFSLLANRQFQLFRTYVCCQKNEKNDTQRLILTFVSYAWLVINCTLFCFSFFFPCVSLRLNDYIKIDNMKCSCLKRVGSLFPCHGANTRHMWLVFFFVFFLLRAQFCLNIKLWFIVRCMEPQKLITKGLKEKPEIKVKGWLLVIL